MNLEMMTLGDVCTKGSSNLAQKDLEGNSGEYEIYGASGLIKKVDFFHQEKPYIAVVKDGAGVGRTMLLPAKSSVIGTMQYIIPNDNIDIEYLYYAITYMDLSRYYMGAAIPHIYFKDYCKEKIFVPDIGIQKNIALKFRLVDSLIAARKVQLTKLGDLTASRFIEMFGNENYPHVKLIDLITAGTGLSYGIVQPGDDGTGDMGVLRPVDLVNGKVSIDSIKYIERSIGDGYKKTELNGDELLITVRGTTGITALTDKRFKGMNVTRGIAVIRYDRRKVNPVYLNVYFNTEESQRYIKEHTRGATLQQINLSDLRIQQIMVPPLTLQTQFADFVTQIDKSKVAVQSSITKCHYLMKKGVNTHA